MDRIGSKTAQGSRQVSSHGGVDQLLGRQEGATVAVDLIASKTAREERPNSLPGKQVAKAKARVSARP